MDVVNAILDASKADSRKSTDVQKDIELDIDEGTLLASDYNALDTKSWKSQPEAYLKSLTRDNVQLLINKIWSLPTERVEEAIVAKLPKPQFVLPRSRAIPKPKPLTKWQQFAKEKGIKSKKKDKSKLKWDEELQKWIPTYGYKRNKLEEQKEWLVEVAENNEPVKDAFTVAKEAKHERKSKNELQRLRNLAKAKNIKLPRVGLPTMDHFANARQLGTAITVARTSTASVGKFQSRLSKEKDAKGIAQEVPGIKRKRKEPMVSLTEERQRNKNLMEGVLNSNKKILLDEMIAPSASAKQPTSRAKRKTKGGKKASGGKKPKAGAGKRDMRLKVGGRKRR